MFDFNPFITNDGSVGLYSKNDNDIYHSVYGALSESYEKFILPANLEYYLKNNSQINFLDICFGIGYNTKSLIQFLMNFSSNNFLNSYLSSLDYSIYTDKINKNADEILSTYNETIGNDKIIHYLKENLSKIFEIKDNKKKFLKDKNIRMDKNSQENFLTDESINIDKDFHKNNACSNEFFKNKSYKISIDAVDLNKNLIMLSPFIKNKLDYKNLLKIDLPEVLKVRGKIKPQKLKKEYQISNEVLKLIFDVVIKSDYMDYDFLNNILFDKKYSQFFSNDLISLYRHYKLCHNINAHLLPFYSFLHNIYYHHISKRFIKGSKKPKNMNFNLKIIFDSAVDFLLTSDKIYDVIFLDAFTPAKCPKLWTIDFLKLIYEHLSNNGIILTYSNSAQVRNAFLHAGFFIGKNYFPDIDKSFGTIASKNKSLIKYELDDYEKGLLNTKAGIFYRDNNFRLSDDDIIKNYKSEFELSNLMSSSKYKKLSNYI